MTIRAWWLRLDNGQYRKLVIEPMTSPPQVDRKLLEQLAAEPGADYGQVTCFNRQTVHVVSGRFRNAVTSVIPVVGQLDRGLKRTAYCALNELAEEGENSAPPADQTIGPSKDRSVGYQPVLTRQHAGALLELTPTRLPENRAVILDLRTVVTRWDDQPEKPVDFRNVVALDRTNIVSQQFATTLTLPLRKPVLVGGLSLQPGVAADAAGAKTQLYLIVEAIDETKGVN